MSKETIRWFDSVGGVVLVQFVLAAAVGLVFCWAVNEGADWRGNWDVALWWIYKSAIPGGLLATGVYFFSNRLSKRARWLLALETQFLLGLFWALLNMLLAYTGGI